MILPECRLGSPFFFFFSCQRGSQASKKCFEQAKSSSDGLAKKLRLWSLLKFKILLRLLKRSPFEGERPWEKSYPSVAFSMVSRSLHNLVRFSTEGCDDSHIKIPKDIAKYLEKERNFLGRLEGERKFFLRKTWRNHLDYLKVK